MRKPIFGLSVLVILLFLAVAHMGYYYPKLPQQVASHFGPGGQPNGWSSKENLMVVYVVLVFGTGGLMTATAFGMRWLPVWMINLPNKDHWLAPECKDETCARLFRDFLWLANATVLFLMGCMHVVFWANLNPKANVDRPFLWLLSTYLVIVLGWCLSLIWRFRKPSEEARQPL